MPRKYNDLDGRKLLKQIRKKNGSAFRKSMIGLPFSVLIGIACIFFMKDTGDYGSGIIILLICILFAAAIIMKLPQRWKTMRNSESAALFQTHGTPDEIAGMIANEYQFARLDDNGVLICASFIMMHSDFESFMRYDKVRFASLLEHQKHGMPYMLYLSLTDLAGTQYRYPIHLRYREEAEDILQMIRKAAGIA